MLILSRLRIIVFIMALVGAGLACTHAEVPITPASPEILTPQGLPTSSQTPTEVIPTDPPTPEITVTPTEGTSTATVDFTPTKTPTATPTLEPSSTPTPTQTATATATLGPPTPTFTPIRLPTATPQGRFSTRTPTSIPKTPTKTRVGALPTKTPTVTLTPTLIPTVGSTPGGVLPPGSSLTQNFAISTEGGTLFGRALDIIDGRTTTWASLRGGNAIWIFDLGRSQDVDGLRLFAHSDAGQATTLLAIEVSTNGTNWTALYTGDGTCSGVPNCDTIQQNEYVDFALGPATVQYLRLLGGPTNLALAEVLIALSP
jgi:hypothetical protein